MPVLNARALRRKIRSVANIKKITRAMEMVSAAKMKKVQGKLLAIRPYADKIQELLGGLAATVRDLNHPLFQPRETVKNVALVVISADKGLCGSFNANILRAAFQFVKGSSVKVRVLPLGRKANDFFKRREEVQISGGKIGLSANVTFAETREITRTLLGWFQSGEVDEVHLGFTEFVNAVTFRPRIQRYLPIDAAAAPTKPAGKGPGPEKAEKPAAKAGAVEYIFEPRPADILGSLVPRYVEVRFFRTLLESMASEHAARMQSMHNATENAQELIDSLTLIYNKARQAGITKELLDIVGGAEALKG